MIRELLKETYIHHQPSAILDGLSPEEATRKVDSAPHSIADILGHLTFWQDWFLARCRGEAEPMASSADAGWPVVTVSEWDAVRRRFLGGLDAAIELGEDASQRSQPLSPPVDFPPMAHYTVGDALTHLAVHNAHHLGQIVTLRQLTGKWPPPAGAWTW